MPKTADVFQSTMDHIWDADPFHLYEDFQDARIVAKLFSGKSKRTKSYVVVTFPDKSSIEIQNKGSTLVPIN